MKLLFASLLATSVLTAQSFGGFVNARVRVLGDDEVAAPAEVKARLPLTLVEDCSAALRASLTRLNLPYREDGRGFWIYGYAMGDPTLPPD